MMKMRLHAWGRRAAGTLAVALLLAACAPVQTTGSGAVGIERRQYISSLVPEQTLNEEAARQYAAITGQARAKGVLDNNAATVKRVRNITQRLIGQVGVFRSDARNWNWQVHVIDSDEVNAWCMPGGKMAIYSGLINGLKPTDAELAAVLGHEMAHALREHAREQVSQQVAAGVGLSILSAITGMESVGDLGGELTRVMFTLPNSRTHEAEADRIGVELAARAGYDPHAAISLWQKMDSLGGGRPPEFLSTHPSPASRMSDLRQAAQRVMPLYQAAR